MSDDLGNTFEGTTPNMWAWIILGVPSVLAWVAAGLAVLLEPHLGGDVYPLWWAFHTVAGWYSLMVVVFFGWVGLLVVAG